MFALLRSKSAAGVVVCIVGLAVVFFLVARDRLGSNQKDNAFFRDAALESGITFRMMFLPDEQGENFKINLYDHGCGVAIGDYDGDGNDDIYFLNQLGKNVLYRNNGDGTFTDVTEKAGVGLGDRICVAATWVDYDNDGHQDLFVTSTRGGNVLFRNQGDGTFKDVTLQAFGRVHIGHSQAAVFFDYDNDGFLDLLVTNTSKWTTDDFDEKQRYYPGKATLTRELMSCPREYNILYHNNGDGTFSVTEKSGLEGHGWSGDVAMLDFDGDGYLDVLITNMFGPSRLYRNNRNGTFSDVTRETLGATSYGCVGVKVFDFNNDGKLDLFLTDMHSDMWMGLDINHFSLELAEKGQKTKYPHVLGPRGAIDSDKQAAAAGGYRPEDVLYGNTLFKNLGGGRFQEMSEPANLETFWPWGIAAADFDNDGYEDVFIPSGMGYPFYYWPNQLMMNNGDETFTDRAGELGIEPPPGGHYLDQRIGGGLACRSSRAAATADFDGDGRLEIVVNNFNDRPYYFKNHFPKKNFVKFKLQGNKRRPDTTGSNRDAIGAVVRLPVGATVMTRIVSPAGGYLAQSSKTLHFGLGARKTIDWAEITWPGGRKQRIDKPTINQQHHINEPNE